MEKETKMDYALEVRKQLDYAVNSHSENLLYQTLGYINAAHELSGITREQYVELSGECCRQINNPANFREG